MIARHIGTLLALEAINRHSSFTAAAQELGISQSAVSMKIARLERELSVRLVERTTRSVVLSPEGQMLVDASRNAISELNAAIAKVQTVQKHGVLTVEVLSSIASKWLIPRLGDFHEKHPGITVRVTIQDDQSEALGPDADLSIRISSSAMAGFHSEFLTFESVFPVCSPELGRELEGLALAEAARRAPLLDDRMALEDGSGCNWRDQFKEVQMTDPSVSDRHLVFDRTDLALQAAISGQGIAIGRTFVSLDDLERGALVCPFGVTERLKWGYYLISRSSVSDWPKVTSFKTWLEEEIGAFKERSKSLKIWRN